MKKLKNNIYFFDSDFFDSEQLPHHFFVVFREVDKNKIQVLLEGNYQVGDIIDDNSYEIDYYRYHDIFHYSFATLLGWSPCTRAMMKRKRKSVPKIDEIEDGARATITEEAISLIIFNEAKRKNFFKDGQKVSKTTLRIIKEMTQPFEVKIINSKEWELAILKAYKIFNQLIDKKEGKVVFDSIKKTIEYIPVNKVA